MAEFFALDVETANPDMASICQIGLVPFSRSSCEGPAWRQFVDPEDDFDEWNTAVHGITAAHVRGAPNFAAVAPLLRARVADGVVVSHTPFDRVAVERALHRYGLPPLRCTWLDSARVARRAWPQFAQSGYGLANVCAECGIHFVHHDAAEDARACGEIVLRAMQDTGFDLDGLTHRAAQPIDLAMAGPIRKQGNPEGPLFGEVLVFTGALALPRREAADCAARAGCTVDSGVTQRTTLLVVGDQDIRKLNGRDKSSKHRKAEQLIASGQPIRILAESDFRHIVALS